MHSQLVIPEDQIPNWIRSANRGLDWGGIIVVIAALIVSLPYWSGGMLTPENDSIHLAFRAHDTTISLLEGVLYPRWSPHAVYGYGAPILHFSPPLASYSTALLTLLFTDSVAVSVGVLMSAALVLGGTATYAYILQHLGARAAFVGALAFLLSPAFSWLLPYHLGDVPTMLATGLLPVFIWALDRTLRETSALDLPLLACVFALLLLCDPTLCTPLALVFGVGACALRFSSVRRLWPHLLIALLCGGALSAFYWLPAALEADAVTWQQFPTSQAPLIHWSNLFTPFITPDPIAATPPSQLTAGLAIVGLGCCALVTQLTTRRIQPFGLVWGGMALGAAASVILLQTASLAAAFAWCAALSGAALLPALGTPRRQRYGYILALVGIAAAYTPVYLAFQRQPLSVVLSEQGQLLFELRGYGIAGVPTGVSIPSRVPLANGPNSSLLTAYTRGLPDRLTLLNGTPDKAVLLRTQSHSSTYTIASASPLNAQYTVNPFVGWQASLDARPIDLLPNQENTGYLFSLPPTRGSELLIYFGTTPTRQAGATVSLVGLGMLLLIWRWQHRRKDWHTHFPSLLAADDLRRMAVVGGSLALIAVTLSSNRFLPAIRPAPGVGLIGSAALNYSSSSSLQLLAYQMNTEQPDLLNVVLHWRVSRPLSDLLFISSSLVSITGEVVTSSEAMPLTRIPTSAWQTHHYYTTTLQLDLALVPSSRRYTLMLRVFPCAAHGTNCATSRALTFFDQRGTRLGTQLTLPQILTR